MFDLLPGERLDRLNGRGLSVIQRVDGYRFSMDAVLLSHFVRPGKNERVMDLGTGCGVIPLLLSAREETLRIDALELDPAAAERAARSVRGNGLSEQIRVLEGDLKALPDSLPRGGYHLVLSNPPYGGRARTGPAKTLPTTDAGCTLADVIVAAAKLTRFSGRFACCWPAARLQEAMTLLSQARFQVKRLRFVQSKPGKAPYLCLMEATFGGRAGLITDPTLLVMTESGACTDELKDIYGEN